MAFPTLNHEKHLDSWMRGMKAEMEAQDIDAICKPGYSESYLGADQVATDRKKQAYLYAIFHRVLKTSASIQLVTKYEGDQTRATKI